MSELKAVLKMTTTCLHTSWKTERRRCHWRTAAAVTAWSSWAHSVLMQCLRSSRSVMRVLYTFSFRMLHTL